MLPRGVGKGDGGARRSLFTFAEEEKEAVIVHLHRRRSSHCPSSQKKKQSLSIFAEEEAVIVHLPERKKSGHCPSSQKKKRSLFIFGEQVLSLDVRLSMLQPPSHVLHTLFSGTFPPERRKAVVNQCSEAAPNQ